MVYRVINKMTKDLFVCLSVSLILSMFFHGIHAAGANDELILVEKGESLASIIVFADPPPKIMGAAEELAEYIGKISGSQPDIIEGEPQPVPEKAVWVGHQPIIDELFPETDFHFEHPEEILITANDSHLVIAGRDRWDPDHLIVQGRNFTIEGKQQEYGTVNAVYTFLQDYLDVRWLWPGELGEDIIEKETLSFSPFTYRYHPQFRQRCDIFRLSSLGDSRGISGEWARFQRLQLDSLEAPGGHPLSGWWNRYHEEHPDYFALQPDGTRSGFPGPGTVKICQSNPAVWEQWISNVADTLEEDPNRTVFGASPNDSWNRGHCICPDCLAWDHPDGAKVRLSWEGITQHYVSLTDRQVIFANKLAHLLKERFPDKDLFVAMSAYGDAYIQPPVEAVPEDNVVMSIVANFFLRQTHGRDRRPVEHFREHFKAWGEVTPNLRWRPNTGNPAGWQQGHPDVVFGRTADAFQFVAENNGIGMFFDTVWEFWPTQGPLYYLMAHMAWNPNTDWEALMDDYYRRGFGPAADHIAAYWKLMEDARERKEGERLPFPEVYDAEFFKEAENLLDRAESALADEPDKFRQRVDFFRTGLEYTRLMVDTRKQMAIYRESEGMDEDAAERVRENWEKKLAIGRENENMMRQVPRPGSRYAAGLHPDH